MNYLDDPQKWKAAYMRGTNNPFGPPVTSIEQQVGQLDPANMPLMTSYKDDVLRQATQSTAGAQARLSSQQKFADALRSTPMPDGQRVGPSQIYVRNPWDAAEAGFNRALGGYLSGKLAPEYGNIDKTESNKAQGIERLKDLRTDEANRFASELADTRIRADDARAVADRASRERTAGADRAAQNERNQKHRTWQHTGNGDILHTVDVNGVQHAITDGVIMGPMSIPPEYIELDTRATGSTKTGADLTANQRDAREAASAALIEKQGRFANLDRMAQYSLDDARKYTGYNPQALLAPYGLGEKGVEAQQFDSLLSYEEVGGLLPAIKEAKLTPVSDNDVKIVRQQFVNASKQPETIAQFYAYQGRQFMSSTISHNVKNGNITAAEGAEILQQYDKKAAMLALRWGYEPQYLKTAGMDPELVDYLVEVERRR